MTFQGAAVSVSKQALAEEGSKVKLNGQQFPVRFTRKEHLRKVDFNTHSQEFRGVEQNPEATSQWARLAREAHRIIEFLSPGYYLANVADGKLTLCNRGTQK
jgi:fructose-1,6-bisphosphatase/inositol monophosphatase family enzyme